VSRAVERPCALPGEIIHCDAPESGATPGRSGIAVSPPPHTESLRILLVEDNEDDARLLARELERGGLPAVIERVDTPDAFTGALDHGGWDVVIADFALPRFGGGDALELLRDRGVDLPFIIVSGSIRDEIAVEMMRAGAHDYLLKEKLTRLVPAIRREVRDAAERRDRRIAEAALRRSEKRWALALEANNDGIFDWDIGTGRVFYSARWKSLLGCREDAFGESLDDWHDRIHPDDRAAVLTAMRDCLEGRALSFESEHRLRHGNGNDRWFLVRAVLCRDDAGNVDRMVGSLADISERRAAQENRAREAEVKAALVRVGSELMPLVGSRRIHERLCSLAAELLPADYAATWLPRRDGTWAPVASSGSFSPAPLSCEALAPLLARLASEPIIEVTAVNDMPQLGGRLCVWIAIWQHGEVGALLAVGPSGATELAPSQRSMARGLARIAATALANARLVEELEGVNQLKSDFVATLSHELRTPLHVILGYLEILLDGGFGALSPEQQSAVRCIDRRGRQLSELISQTLDLSRLEAGLLPLDLADVNVRAMLDVLAAEVAERRENGESDGEAEVALRIEIDPEVGAIRTDGRKLRVVLNNLIGNAFKFTDRGFVTVAARPCGDGVEFAITDTGIGMSPEVLPVIFDSFRQGDSSDTRRHGGVGLGLFIVRRLVERLGGTIRVESEVGRGSVFEVWLPRTAGE
jgi:PAS domain S-box-containing protein